MEITHLLQLCCENKASDLHLAAGMPPLLRVHGHIRNLGLPVISSKRLQDILENIMTAHQRQILNTQLEVDFAFILPAVARCRVNVYQQAHGVAAAFRIVPEHVPTLEQLQAPKLFADIAAHPQGLILITGPTGSGKSTTLAAMIHHINANYAKHIITIEDPIEFKHQAQKSLITQREVHNDTLSFEHALRSALRQDPDVIMLGEMRDLATIRLALTAAETGHAVFATLHTTSAAKTIDRIIDVFPGNEKDMVRAMLAESLHAVVAQRLLAAKDDERIAVYEILLATPAIRNLIREAKVAQIYSTMQNSQALGMQTFEQCMRKLTPHAVRG